MVYASVSVCLLPWNPNGEFGISFVVVLTLGESGGLQLTGGERTHLKHELLLGGAGIIHALHKLMGFILASTGVYPKECMHGKKIIQTNAPILRISALFTPSSQKRNPILEGQG